MGNYKVDKHGCTPRKLKTSIECKEDLTVQSHAKGMSVNEIMARFSQTGTIPSRRVPGVYMDASVVPSMFDALNKRVQLNQYFSGLPSVIREKFANDPMKLVTWVGDAKNHEEAVKLGLLIPKKKAPSPAEVMAAAVEKGVKGATPPPPKEPGKQGEGQAK